MSTAPTSISYIRSQSHSESSFITFEEKTLQDIKKALGSSATPLIRFIRGDEDPESIPATELLGRLRVDLSTPLSPSDKEKVAEISKVSFKGKNETWSPARLVDQVVLPLLRVAIGDSPLEAMSCRGELINPIYLPCNVPQVLVCSIDIVFEFPRALWKFQYKAAGAEENDMSHISNTYGGPGFVVKSVDVDILESQIELGVWMAGYLTWLTSHHNRNIDITPLGGCTVRGDVWDFYVAFGEYVRDDINQVEILVRVNVWGPLPDLTGFTGNTPSAMSLACTLRRIIDFTKGDFIDKLLNAVAVV
ncbi:hypothetical protein N7519_005365 [Penicillium mononematosum]|uniref:uncharacterized protein n=1 Tax=Penicillium mononematosum TaxID=268346 RepID=UPI00254889B0|nr:uncharacterized protein N7519_005365 [Penicillium mononematosum]KAJ6184064.1 hypothetical protein N7519_005365 [Penicillium mononematosum]